MVDRCTTFTTNCLPRAKVQRDRPHVNFPSGRSCSGCRWALVPCAPLRSAWLPPVRRFENHCSAVRSCYLVELSSAYIDRSSGQSSDGASHLEAVCASMLKGRLPNRFLCEETVSPKSSQGLLYAWRSHIGTGYSGQCTSLVSFQSSIVDVEAV